MLMERNNTGFNIRQKLTEHNRRHRYTKYNVCDTKYAIQNILYKNLQGTNFAFPSEKVGRAPLRPSGMGKRGDWTSPYRIGRPGSRYDLTGR